MSASIRNEKKGRSFLNLPSPVGFPVPCLIQKGISVECQPSAGQKFALDSEKLLTCLGRVLWGWGRRTGPCTLRYKLNKFEHVWGRAGAGVRVLYKWGQGLGWYTGTPRRQTILTENTTFPQLRWRVVNIVKF